MPYLPWEKLLPPYVYGPLMCIGSVAYLFLGEPKHWWGYVMAVASCLTGAWITWKEGAEDQNASKHNADKDSEAK